DRPVAAVPLRIPERFPREAGPCRSPLAPLRRRGRTRRGFPLTPNPLTLSPLRGKAAAQLLIGLVQLLDGCFLLTHLLVQGLERLVQTLNDGLLLLQFRKGSQFAVAGFELETQTVLSIAEQLFAQFGGAENVADPKGSSIQVHEGAAVAPPV